MWSHDTNRPRTTDADTIAPTEFNAAPLPVAAPLGPRKVDLGVKNELEFPLGYL
jgi:hypothetical protein